MRDRHRQKQHGRGRTQHGRADDREPTGRSDRRSQPAHRARHGETGDGPVQIYGIHAVEAALANPARVVGRLLLTENAAHRLGPALTARGASGENVAPRDLDRRLGAETVHQGALLETEALPEPGLEELVEHGEGRPLIVLDQVTDPHNVGAIMRSAAAFNACAIVTQDRHAPPESGTLAKSASGALEVVPWVRVVNLARALDEIAEAGYWRIGLDGAGPGTLAEALPTGPVALVLGAEGDGMRHNIVQHCDALARLPISSAIESLNVSNAAAIALYAIATRA